MTTYPTFWPRFVARAEKKEAANSKRRLPIRADTLHRLVRRFESPLNLALKKLIKSNNTAHFKEQEMGFKFPCESHSDSHVLTSQPRVTQWKLAHEESSVQNSMAFLNSGQCYLPKKEP